MSNSVFFIANQLLKMEEKTQRLNKDEKVFVVKTFYENLNKSETCRLFEKKFQRNINRDTVSKLIQRFEDTGSTDDLPRPRRPVTACSPENCEIIRFEYVFVNKTIIYYSLHYCKQN